MRWLRQQEMNFSPPLRKIAKQKLVLSGSLLLPRFRQKNLQHSLRGKRSMLNENRRIMIEI